MQLFFTALVSLLVSAAGVFGIYNYIPLEKLEVRTEIQRKLGATITTIAGGDTLSSSRTTINDNFTNLNNGKTEVSSSSIAAITTLANLTSAAALATVGTLTSGSLGSGFTAVVVGRGGTGSTTLSANQVLLGSTTNAVNVVSGWGTSGQFLTSNGGVLAPTWQSATVNQNDDYTWTGLHGFGSSTPAARVGIQGNAFVSGTTTTGVLTATSSASIGGNLSVTSTGTSTISGNLAIDGNASTTNVIISGVQVGGTWDYTGSSTVYSVSAGTVTVGTIPTNANFGLIQATVNDSTEFAGTVMLAREGLTSAIFSFNAATLAGTDGKYTFSWSGDSLSIVENVDDNSDSSVTGTAYWYK